MDRAATTRPDSLHKSPDHAYQSTYIRTAKGHGDNLRVCHCPVGTISETSGSHLSGQKVGYEAMPKCGRDRNPDIVTASPVLGTDLVFESWQGIVSALPLAVKLWCFKCTLSVGRRSFHRRVACNESRN
jgi:hypothetical protein